MNCKNIEEFVEKRKEIQSKMDAEELKYDSASTEYQMANEAEHDAKMEQLWREFDSVHYICK
jgi:hypothetical protein